MNKRLDVFLQYYKPHVSGLTNMAAELAEHAARNNLEVHVHCVSLEGETHHQNVNGVEVHAYRKSFSLARASFSFELIGAIWRIRRLPGVAHVHMPYPESFVLAMLLSREWKVVSTYQCDAPKGKASATLIAALLDWSHKTLIRRSIKTVVSSADYASYSRLSKIIDQHNPAVIPVTSVARRGGVPNYKIPGRKLIGFMGRPTHEKGIDVLLEAMQLIEDDSVTLLFAGPVDGVLEKVGYNIELANQLISQGKLVQVGFLEENQIKDFLASLDVYVHPSINSFDAFGIVQLEAVSAGVPVVASDIPGVRTVVESTKFGEITRAGDPKDLARGLKKALRSTYNAQGASKVLRETYLYPIPHNQYLELYKELFMGLDNENLGLNRNNV